MVNQELLDYIKAALASGQSREAITQALVQNGWDSADAQEGLTIVTGEPMPLRPSQETIVHTPPQTQEINSAGSVSNSYVQAQPENQVRPQVASTRSILPMAIIAGTAVIIVGIGVMFLILTKNSTTPSQLAIEQTIPVKATTTDQNPQVLATTSSQAQLSEIDKYGVDLYALKQGETTIEKKIDGESGKITYTRSKNEIKRKVVISYANGGKETLTATIDLDSKEKLLVLMEKGEAFLGSVFCKDSSVKECADSKVGLNYLKINCLVLQKNEEIGMCLVAATLSAETNRQPSNVNSLKNTIESTNALDLSTEKERDAKRFSDINQIQRALDLYYSKKHGYPVYLEELVNEKFLPEELTDPSVPVGYTADYLYLSYSKYDPIQKTGTECNSSPCAHYVLGAAFEQKDYKVPGMTAGEVPGCFGKQLGRFCYSVAK